MPGAGAHTHTTDALRRAAAVGGIYNAAAAPSAAAGAALQPSSFAALRCLSSAAAPAPASPAASSAKSTRNVPLGHHDSDLSSTACHIGLGRRRDLAMRGDVGLWKANDTRLSLADVFRVRAFEGGVCVWRVLGRGRRVL